MQSTLHRYLVPLDVVAASSLVHEKSRSNGDESLRSPAATSRTASVWNRQYEISGRMARGTQKRKRWHLAYPNYTPVCFFVSLLNANKICLIQFLLSVHPWSLRSTSPEEHLLVSISIEL